MGGGKGANLGKNQCTALRDIFSTTMVFFVNWLEAE